MLAVGAVCHALDNVRVFLEDSSLQPRFGVPVPIRIVHATSEYVLAVGAERHAVDNRRVSLEDGHLLPRLGVPEPRCVVAAPGEDMLAVGAERHAVNHARVSLEHSSKRRFSEQKSANVTSLPNVFVCWSDLLEQCLHLSVILLLSGP